MITASLKFTRISANRLIRPYVMNRKIAVIKVVQEARSTKEEGDSQNSCLVVTSRIPDAGRDSF